MRAKAPRFVYVFDSWRLRKLPECRVVTHDNQGGDTAPEWSGTWDELRQAIFAAADDDTRYKVLVGYSREAGPEWDEVL